MARVDQNGNVGSSGNGLPGVLAAWGGFQRWVRDELRSIGALLRMMR